jgi:hypothetical protein
MSHSHLRCHLDVICDTDLRHRHVRAPGWGALHELSRTPEEGWPGALPRDPALPGYSDRLQAALDRVLERYYTLSSQAGGESD